MGRRRSRPACGAPLTAARPERASPSDEHAVGDRRPLRQAYVRARLQRPLRDDDPADDQRAADGDRHRDVLAEHDRGEDEPRDRAAGTAASRSGRCRRDRAPSTSRRSRESTSRPRGRRPSPRPSAPASARRRARRAPTRAARARTSRAGRPRASSRGSRGRAAAASRPRHTRPRRTAPRRARAGRRASVASVAAVPRPPISTASPTSATAQPGEPRAARHAAGDDRRVGAREDRQRREDHHAVQRRGALLPDRVDDREDARSRPPPRSPSSVRECRARRQPLPHPGEQRDRHEAREDRAQARDDERRQVVEREPRHDRRRRPRRTITPIATATGSAPRATASAAGTRTRA